MQKTLAWNEDRYLDVDWDTHILKIAPGENNRPQSLIFDEDAEELSFPAIYYGQSRKFRDEVTVTPFMIASSETRRKDRLAVTAEHLLYMGMKQMRLRMSKALNIAFKHVGHNTKITKQQIRSPDYIYKCIEKDLAFFRSIPNSTVYWMDKEKGFIRVLKTKWSPNVVFNHEC